MTWKLCQVLIARPAQVNWDSSKDDALWKILSGAAQTEIDCESLFMFQLSEPAS